MTSTDKTASIRWRKSTYSGDNGNCVEVARFPSNRIALRDSKDATGPMLLITPKEWRRFIAKVLSLNPRRDFE
jgi:hypothetical protein